MAKIEFTGNLGKDAELKFLNSGRAVLNFSVADSKSKKLESGEWETIAEQWLDCAIWGELAEFYHEKLKKGTRATFYGEFYSRKYQNKEGVPGVALDVNVKGVDILPSRNSGGQQQGSSSQNSSGGGWGGNQPTGGNGWGQGGADTNPPF